MSVSPDPYQALYENALQEITHLQQKLAAQLEAQQLAQTQLGMLQQKLTLALFEIEKLRRKLFGRSADNRTSQADPIEELSPVEVGASEADLQAIEETTKQEVKQEKQIEKAAKKRENYQRMELPADLPRQEVIIHPDIDLTDYVQIGQDVTEVLEITPPTFWVKRIVRTKWVRKNPVFTEPGAKSDIIVAAPIPCRTVARGLFGDTLLAYLVISKFLDHLPLHRQFKIFERVGIRLAASTLSDNIAAVCKLLEPLYNSLRREVLANRYLQADETSLRVQDGEKPGACHLGYLWAYHAQASKLVLFDYQRGRGQEGPAKLLADFKGVLQTDGYAVYGSLFEKSDRVTLAACMAHARRKFDEAFKYDPFRAKYAVAQIAKLYALEQEMRDAEGMDERTVCQLRLKVAAPILEELKVWLDTESSRVLPNSSIGKAISYTLKLWDRLTVYLYHGQLQIDNNLIENCIRPIALGRKNYLFSGSHAAAQNTAMLYSFLGSCQRNNIPPQLWLSDVLEKLNDPDYEGKFSDLLPNRWPPRWNDAVRK